MKKILPIILLLSFFSPQAVFADITTGLKAWWKFDEGAGTNAFDSSGGGQTASFTDSPVWITGKIGRHALSFDGVNDALSAAVDLSSTDKATIAFWLWKDSFANDDDLAFEYTPTFNNNNGFLVDPNSSGGSFELDISTVPGPLYNGGTFTRPSTGAWHHYVIGFDRTTGSSLGVTLYVDGVSTSVTQNLSATMTGNYANSSLYFMSRAASSLFSAGRLDEVRLYTRILTVSDALELYNFSGVPITRPRLFLNSGKFIIVKGKLIIQ
jgi:hypothetical protein